MLPGLVNQMPGTTSNTGKNNTTINQVATEVTTDVTTAVDKASQAVVGITNIQEVTSGGFGAHHQRQQKRQEAVQVSFIKLKVTKPLSSQITMLLKGQSS